MNLCCSYEGEYEGGRFGHHGTYVGENGKYVGDFQNGLFHGNGILYVKGGRFEGLWDKGDKLP
jgi:hypothetical protein